MDVESYPYSLAQLNMVVRNAKSGTNRFLAAYSMWEASLKLLAITAIAEYAALPSDRGIDGTLRKINRPTAGSWREYVEKLVPYLAEERGVAEFKAVNEQLGSPLSAIPDAAELNRFLSKCDDDSAPSEENSASDDDSAPSEEIRGTLWELLMRITRLRNRVIGHGSMGQKSEDEYESLHNHLQKGLSAILTRLDVHAGREVVVVESSKNHSTHVKVECYRLVGMCPSRAEIAHPRGTNLDPLPNQVYLMHQGRLIHRLDPLLFCDMRNGWRHIQVYLYNTQVKNQWEGLDYVTDKKCLAEDQDSPLHQFLIRVSDRRAKKGASVPAATENETPSVPAATENETPSVPAATENETPSVPAATENETPSVPAATSKRNHSWLAGGVVVMLPIALCMAGVWIRNAKNNPDSTTKAELQEKQQAAERQLARLPPRVEDLLQYNGWHIQESGRLGENKEGYDAVRIGCSARWTILQPDRLDSISLTCENLRYKFTDGRIYAPQTEGPNESEGKPMVGVEKTLATTTWKVWPGPGGNLLELDQLDFKNPGQFNWLIRAEGKYLDQAVRHAREEIVRCLKAAKLTLRVYPKGYSEGIEHPVPPLEDPFPLNEAVLLKPPPVDRSRAVNRFNIRERTESPTRSPDSDGKLILPPRSPDSDGKLILPPSFPGSK